MPPKEQVWAYLNDAEMRRVKRYQENRQVKQSEALRELIGAGLDVHFNGLTNLSWELSKVSFIIGVVFAGVFQQTGLFLDMAIYFIVAGFGFLMLERYEPGITHGVKRRLGIGPTPEVSD